MMSKWFFTLYNDINILVATTDNIAVNIDKAK